MLNRLNINDKYFVYAAPPIANMWNGGAGPAHPAPVLPRVHRNMLAPELGMVEPPHTPLIRPIQLPLVPPIVPRHPVYGARGPIHFAPIAEAADLPRMPAPPPVPRMVIPLPNVDEEPDDGRRVRFADDEAG